MHGKEQGHVLILRPTGVSVSISVTSKQYKPLLNLPGKEFFSMKNGEPLNGFETTLQVRYAYQERFLETNFSRSSLGSEYPIAELKYTHGWKGVLNSSYTY